MKKNIILTFLITVTLLAANTVKAAKRPMEYLDRGEIAINTDNGVFLSWRYLGTDTLSTAFNIYRDENLITTVDTSAPTNYLDASGTSTSTYKVVPIIEGTEDTTGVKSITPWAQNYKSIKLNRPPSGITEPNQYGSVGKSASGTFPNGQPYGYSPNDFSVGDLDGDGEYELIVKWDPSNSHDNSQYGITGKVYIDAYKFDGTQLWRIDLGLNIRAGAHYTQFLVYDFDGDGRAELVCKTAPGTIDGEGNYVIMDDDDSTADYRSLDYDQIKGSKMLGTVLKGPEYLTLFDGLTGAELNSVEYDPQRGSLSNWGDSYGNRSERYLACVAYLDGQNPSAVFCRGYYKRATVAAWKVKNKKLVEEWLYDSGSSDKGISAYGQGNHNLSVADVDSDGNDEIIWGSCAFDDDGSLLYSTELGHGDAMHLSDLDPDHDGLEVWEVHEESVGLSKGYEMHDANTGEIIWSGSVSSDNGRGLAADIDANSRGFEMWSTGGTGTYSCTGTQLSTTRPSVNFRIYWDGDLQDELLDGNTISKWTGSGTSNLLSVSGYSSCNSTKKTPNLSADILGDWREELILWNTTDSCSIRIYSTTATTDYKLFTLMHDPIYRLGIAWQNTAYNQPPHLGFYIGDGLDNVTLPDITTIKYDSTRTEDIDTIVTDTTSSLISPTSTQLNIYNNNGVITVTSEENIQSVAIYTITGQIRFLNNSINNREYHLDLNTFYDNKHFFIVKVKTESGRIKTAKIVN